MSKVDDLHLSWSDILIQFLNLEVKNKFEFLELLSPSLESKNQFLLLGYLDVLQVDLLSLLLPLLFQLLNVLPLILQLSTLVLDLPIEGINL